MKEHSCCTDPYYSGCRAAGLAYRRTAGQLNVWEDIKISNGIKAAVGDFRKAVHR